MIPTSRFVCLISPESPVYSRALLQAYARRAAKEGSRLQSILIDLPNRFNISVFENVPLEEASRLAASRGAIQLKELAIPEVSLVGWTTVASSPSYWYWLSVVTRYYRQSGTFRRHCLNETFSNLQPRFRRLGVTTKRNPAVSTCVQFLLEEIACKVSSFVNPDVTGELMPHRESQLFLQIYSGRYFNCTRNGDPFRIIYLPGDEEEELSEIFPL